MARDFTNWQAYSVILKIGVLGRFALDAFILVKRIVRFGPSEEHLCEGEAVFVLNFGASFAMPRRAWLCIAALVASPLAGLPPLVPVASAQSVLWTRQLGTASADAALGVAVEGGGAFVGGVTEGNLGGPNLGFEDAFIARYDSDGTQLWAKQFGTAGDDALLSLTSDGAGGLVAAGWTDRDMGSPSAGGEDAFVTRYDSAGNRLWLHQFGTGVDDRAYAVGSDGAGGFFVAGKTWGALAAPNPTASGDVFVAHYDAAGNQNWLRQFGTADSEKPDAVAHDGASGVYVTGETTGSLGGPINGYWDAFLVRYDASGNQLWVKQFGTSGDDAATGLAIDGSGGVFVAGFTDGSLGGPNQGDQDAFIARYSANGQEQWIRQFGTIEFDSAQGLVADGNGGAWIAGVTGGSLGGPLAGIADAFLTRYDADGDVLSMTQFGSTSVDVPQSVSCDGSGIIMVAGFTEGDLGGPNAGLEDVFLTKFADSCYADCDKSTGNGVLDVFDFLCFQNSFVSGETYACDCDTSTGNGVCDVFDFLCFQNTFVGGCP